MGIMDEMPTLADATIVRVRGREILDSRGHPTVEAEIHLRGGVVACAAAPSGASTGGGEATELRDNETRMMGRGTRRACENLNTEIANALLGMNAADQETIDQTLIAADGDDNKSRLGANALLAASLATAKAAAHYHAAPLYRYLANGTTMPAPMMNILNGGAHADNNVDIQEFMIMPLGFADFAEALFAGTEVFYALKNTLVQRGLGTAVGDEGGFAPNLRGTTEALDLLIDAILRAGYTPGKHMFIALDCAATELFADGVYRLPGDKFCGDAAALIARYADWRARYPIISIEDGCAENDWHGWQMLTATLGDSTQLVGDDLFVTNCVPLQRGISRRIANALLAKPNQIGTLSETRRAVKLAQQSDYGVILSHRSGETEYADLADLAVAWDAGQIKTGAPCRGERTAKYNRLLRIGEELGADAVFGGAAMLSKFT